MRRDQRAIGEISGYDDLMGRRIAAFRCDAEDSTEVNWGPSGDCKARTTMFDYYGVSQRVAAVRLSPWWYVGGGGFGYENRGDKFNESYTYGPVGATTRTVETEDADPGDNFDHWVLPDVLGGTTGLLAKVGTGARERVFEHFDAFGVRVGADSTWSADYDGSRYRWRSQEGSETDDLRVSDNYAVGLQPPALVYMQTRHYDPSLGRFIMADSIPMGAFSPQGLNRYAYCTNDPVNLSDPSGRLVLLAAVAIILLVALLTGGINAWFGGSFWNGFFAGAIGAALGFVLAPILGAALGGAAAGALSSGLLSGLNGDSLECILISAALGAGGGAISSGTFGGLPWDDLALELGAALAGSYSAFLASAFVGLGKWFAGS